jgi:hypothetical protein
MRRRALGGTAAVTVASACTLGVVDLPADPGPAELLVVTEMAADPADPSLVQVQLTATLDPGTGLDGTPRRIVSEVLGVEGTDHAPTESADPGHLMWLATETYASPGPEGVQLRLPRLEGLGLGETVNMRVRVDVTPGATILVADGEDLVLTAEPPSNPAQTLDWSLELTSPSMSPFLLEVVGATAWPSEVRVPAEEIPPTAFPVDAVLRIQWDRSLTLFELTPDERYDLALRSVMVVTWTVDASP